MRRQKRVEAPETFKEDWPWGLWISHIRLGLKASKAGLPEFADCNLLALVSLLYHCSNSGPNFAPEWLLEWLQLLHLLLLLLRRISEPPPATTTPVNNYCWRILHSQLQGEISYVLFSSPFQQHCRQLRSLDSEHDSNYMGTTLRKKDEDPLPPA